MRILVAVALTSALTAGSVAAQQQRQQQPKITVGFGGDWVMYSPFLEAGSAGGGARLEDGLAGSLFLEYWLSPWLAVHGDVVHGRPKLAVPGQYDGVNVSALSAGAMVRPFGPAPITPYLVGSAGLITYGLGGPAIRLRNTNIILDTDKTEQLMLQGGAGVDLTFLTREDRVTGVRLQATRMQVFDRPFRREAGGSDGGQGHWRLMIGLFNSIW